MGRFDAAAPRGTEGVDSVAGDGLLVTSEMPWIN